MEECVGSKEEPTLTQALNLLKSIKDSETIDAIVQVMQQKWPGLASKNIEAEAEGDADKKVEAEGKEGGGEKEEEKEGSEDEDEDEVGGESSLPHDAIPLQTTRLLGQGTSGKAYEVLNPVDNAVYALKKVPLDLYVRAGDDEVTKQAKTDVLMNEGKIFSRVHHGHNVVPYVYSWVERGHLCILMEACKEELWDALENHFEKMSELENELAKMPVGCKEHGSTSALVPVSSKEHVEYLDRHKIRQLLIGGLNRICQDKPDNWSEEMISYLAEAGMQSPEANFNAPQQQAEFFRSSSRQSLIQVKRSERRRSLVASTVKPTLDRIKTVGDPTAVLTSPRGVETPQRVAVTGYHDTPEVPGIVRAYDRVHWSLELAEGVAYIHDCGVIHRDLSPWNIWIDCHGHAKIGDFGLSVFSPLGGPALSGIQAKGAVPLDSSAMESLYSAPELGQEAYDHAVDIFSLGITLVALWAPVSTIDEMCDVVQDLKEGGKFPSSLARAHGNDLAKLLAQATSKEPDKRPTAEQFLGDLKAILHRISPEKSAKHSTG